ncbi:T9SS type A sorting domain-containing protein [Flammeovirga yaeyamensis]|uniref:T9SS type A sorting domain-containing protein n=1 Tax=Flammeovirga yaeyamensis TaxID=367791 RepID=A0AAX1N161_9BACT|nr:T9SS type A sorting domain-containing protein [Flammeovirga yaeyamensis]MBB3698345.1 hypothetical protein [Flammeovirga yaeyamensis]NMF34302.1 hypothetical protein [Flammeovirga yaeyamensis]QWG01285.1 T9SS type A sorting domain-containing protein [Flammeovirga yaeyamensis]
MNPKKILFLAIINFLIIESYATTQTIHGRHYKNFYVAPGDIVVVSGDLYFDSDYSHNGQNYSSNGSSPHSFLIDNGGTLVVQGSLYVDGLVTMISQHGKPNANHPSLPVNVRGNILIQRDLKTNGAINFHSTPQSNLIVLGNIIKTQEVYGGRHGNAAIHNDIIGTDRSHHYLGEHTQIQSSFFHGGGGQTRITPDTKDQIPPIIKNLITTYAPNSQAGVALPVKLVYFKAEVVENSVHLKWETATEINSKLFILQRSSTENEKFKNIEKFKAAGNSNTTIKYEFEDKNVSYGNHIYRLIERDIDGKEQNWTQLIHISSHKNDGRILNVYPIPCKSVLNIELNNLEENDQLDIELIHTGTGQKIPVVHEQESERYHQQLNVREMENGIYVLIVNDNGKSIFKKEIVIQH